VKLLLQMDTMPAGLLKVGDTSHLATFGHFTRFAPLVPRRVDAETERLVVKMAKENPTWGYDRTEAGLAGRKVQWPVVSVMG
jgi:hypothetical protein